MHLERCYSHLWMLQICRYNFNLRLPKEEGRTLNKGAVMIRFGLLHFVNMILFRRNYNLRLPVLDEFSAGLFAEIQVGAFSTKVYVNEI